MFRQQIARNIERRLGADPHTQQDREQLRIGEQRRTERKAGVLAVVHQAANR